jgi:hydroxymethylbilane synthase
MIAYLERDYPQDILIRKESAKNKEFTSLNWQQAV